MGGPSIGDVSMARRCRVLALVVAAGLCSVAASASDSGILGWVEDSRGTPVPGALVSLFGKGLRGGGMLTFSDSTGRFLLPALPAGSYTLRALGGDSAVTRQITVLPNRDAVFTLSLSSASTPDADTAMDNGTPAERELRWLLRHKRRSVLETRDAPPEPRAAAAPAPGNLLEGLLPWIPDLGGRFELAASPPLFGPGDSQAPADATMPIGALRLQGALPGSGRWSLGGLLADSASTTWRMAAEFVLDAGSSHRLQTGGGYGTWLLEPGFGRKGDDRQDNRNIGGLFVNDRYRASDSVSLTGGLRYSYLGFVADRNQLSPSVGVEWRPGRRTRVRAAASAQTVAPGGDLLTLSTLATGPAMALAVVSPGLRAERVQRQELGLERSLGGFTLGAFALREGVRDRLVNLVDVGPRGSLRIVNGRGVVLSGAGLTLERRIGDLLRGSVTYTFGQSRPGANEDIAAATRFGQFGTDAHFHDVVTRVEAFVDRTDTRIVAYYRFNTWLPESDVRAPGSPANTRFDVQVTQGLPFLKSMTRTDWEVLLAFRNLFYETTEGAFVDEIAVVNPPKRVVGGISVRF
jgi:outer membrane receptor protein involved in Fe transport